MIKPKTIHIHDQHGQSAFKPNARTRSNEPEGTAFDVVVYTLASGSGETCSIHLYIHL